MAAKRAREKIHLAFTYAPDAFIEMKITANRSVKKCSMPFRQMPFRQMPFRQMPFRLFVVLNRPVLGNFSKFHAYSDHKALGDRIKFPDDHITVKLRGET